jgi:lysozyme
MAMEPRKNTLRRKAGIAALCCTLVGGFEGVRQAAYLDPVGIPTACFGETKNIRLGMRFSMEQCNAMLLQSLYQADDEVDACIKVPLSDTRRAALVSFTYNVGGANLCQSTLARKLNAGDTVGGCNEFSKWVYAKGIKLPGLVKRREAERELCLKGLA